MSDILKNASVPFSATPVYGHIAIGLDARSACGRDGRTPYTSWSQLYPELQCPECLEWAHG